MLNQGGIKKTTAVSNKTILVAPELAFSMSCMIADTNVVANEKGKKIVKAGTPLAGSLLERQNPFTVATGETAVGIVLHDVDVTAGTANSQVVVFGFVDESKLESSVVEMLTETIKSKLKITFVK